MAETIMRRADAGKLSPMMEQYMLVKDQYEDFILMYRLGDFYECFFDDAVVVSKELGLTLTGRDCGDGKRAAMCGVPFHKYDVYVGKLVDKGHKVAICEQMEDPKSAVGLVKREVIRVVTPGTITDSDLLNEKKNNFLASVAFTSGMTGAAVAFADISTGEVSVTYLEGEGLLSSIENEMAAFQPSELMLNVSAGDCVELCTFVSERFHTMITDSYKAMFRFENSLYLVKDAYADDAERLTEPEMSMAVGALLAYIRETQKTETSFVRELNVYSKGQYLELDANTRRNLELIETMRTKEKKGSLLWVLDKTKTAMGARLLRSWLLKPLRNPVEIENRQAAVRDFVNDRETEEDLSEILSDIFDLERLTAKSVYGTANAKDLRAICTSLRCLPKIREAISRLPSRTIREILSKMDTLDDIADLLDRAIDDDPPLTVREGGMIRKGFHPDLDHYRSVKENASQLKDDIERREREATGIKTLKVGYNKVFGYYIEVTKSLTDQVPDRYIRKQTLTGCERYITQELKDLENDVLNADEKIVALEFELFTGLRRMISDNRERLREAAAFIAELDVYRAFAEVAVKNNYVCPEVDLSGEIEIRDGRHPVVEKFVTDSYFVPNDTHLNTEDSRMMIITGPNMAGKSTYMRQVAVIVIMAQIGSFVPAKEARIGVIDKVFTRVGASDDLASGQSTFMLEMSEVAFILKNATKRSLIIYDEVGRGTSTYDGMAIARAVVEYTHSPKIGAKTLFATHYHEMVSMEGEYPGIVNYNIAAKKKDGGIIFLRKIVRGGTDDSYGIEVAKLAGVPSEVVRRARTLLEQIEAGKAASAPAAPAKREEYDLLSALTASKDGEVAEKLRAADLNTMTPIEAMNLVFTLKKMLE